MYQKLYQHLHCCSPPNVYLRGYLSHKKLAYKMGTCTCGALWVRGFMQVHLVHVYQTGALSWGHTSSPPWTQCLSTLLGFTKPPPGEPGFPPLPVSPCRMGQSELQGAHPPQHMAPLPWAQPALDPDLHAALRPGV